MTSPKKLSAGALLLLALGAGIGHGVAQWRAGSAPALQPAAPAEADSSAAVAGERRVLYWYDPMAPQQKFDRPGKSPFMDMALVPRYAEDAGGAGVAVDARVAQTLGVRTAVVQRQRVAAALQLPATVQLNEREVVVLQARAAGFVQRVARLAPGDVVAPGALVAELLLPDWAAAQQEFLALRRAGDAALTAAARQRLLLLGMPATQVERLERAGEVQAVTAVRAPAGGLLQELQVRPGMTVTPGMSLARITGLSSVWVEAALPEAQAALARVGAPVEVALAAYPGERLRARLAAVLPEASSETRTLRLRVELPNPRGRLRAGMFARMTLGAAAEEALVVPAEAVIRTGERAVAYVVEQPGRFVPVPLRLGREWGDKLEVLEGLQAGQQVVVSGQFLIDSEASLRGVLERQAPAVVEHEASGRLVALAAREVTLEHDAVPALQWPAMRMDFGLARPGLGQGLRPGDRVRFSFREGGEGYEVTALHLEARGGDQ